MKIHTYVISLRENNEERRANIDKQLTKTGILYDVVDAIPGESIQKSISTNLDKKNARPMRPGQIGCALSHIKCYELAKKNDLDFVLIFEDDFKVLTDFTKNLNLITQKMTKNSICQLHWTTYPDEILHFDAESKTSLPDGQSMYKLKSGRPLCATAYICSRNAYEALLSNLIPLYTVADDWAVFQSEGYIQDIFFVDPSPVTISNFASQIGYAPGGRLKKMAEWIQFKRIPILRSIAMWHLNELAKKNVKRQIE